MNLTSVREHKMLENSNSDCIDKRTICARTVSVNKRYSEEKQKVLEICNSEEFDSKTHSEIVLILADRGIYVAGESTFYKVLKEAKQLEHRG